MAVNLVIAVRKPFRAVKQLRAILPHPSPLPLGEGASSAALSEFQGRSLPDSLVTNASSRLLFPSPSGRGIKGEGEPCDERLAA